LFLILGALFKFVPNAQVSVRHAAIGGIAAAAVFKLAFALFAWVSQYLVYDAIYGALAALPAFLLWLFLVWLIVLLGAVLVCSCAAQQGAQAVE
jgi:membrane protein